MNSASQPAATQEQQRDLRVAHMPQHPDAALIRPGAAPLASGLFSTFYMDEAAVDREIVSLSAAGLPAAEEDSESEVDDESDEDDEVVVEEEEDDRY